MAEQKSLEQLLQILEESSRLVIVLQDYPDPDAIASAAALRFLANAMAGVSCSIMHGGAVGRAENQAMVRYLDVPFRRMNRAGLDRYDLIAMVDTQPGTGNNSLPAKILPDIVIDHHPIRRLTRRAEFHDIRSRYGATATILWEYLRDANLPPDVRLATALVYAIRSDTHDLGRDTTQADIDAFLNLYPIANKKALSRIEWERVPRGYFVLLSRALRNAETFGPAVVTRLGRVNNPDMVAEVADLLLRNEGSEWSFSCGVHKKNEVFSIRTSKAEADAGKVARRLVGRDGSGGGHMAMAAGRIPIPSRDPVVRERMERRLTAHFLRAIGVKEMHGADLVPGGTGG